MSLLLSTLLELFILTFTQLNPVMLGQDKLEKIFHAALARFGCFVELGTELQGLQNLGDRVRVHLLRRGFSLDPNAGTPETSEYEWVIGADGARGVVRNLLGLAFHGERKVENFIVGDICVENLSQKVRDATLPHRFCS